MKRQRPGRYESSASIAVLAMTSVCACTLSFDGPGEATGDVARRDAAGPDSAGLDARPSDLGGSDVGADVARACTSDGDCDDRLDCTLDACDSGRCTWTPDDSRCGIGGGGGPVTVCAAARCDPARGCVVGAAPVGTACDDGDACTSTSSCDAEGRCTGPSRCPDDGDPCTVSVCGTGGTCGVIDVEDGTACGASSQCCGGTCFDVATDAMHCGSCGRACRGWIPTCESGVCTSCASAADCTDDGIACTVVACTDARCTHEVDGDSCLVDGICREADAPNPTNPCLRCRPGRNRNGWSAVGNGSPCDDGMYCTQSDVCVSGACRSGSPRSCDDGNDCTADSCDEAADACESSMLANGDACAGGYGLCCNGACADPTVPCAP